MLRNYSGPEEYVGLIFVVSASKQTQAKPCAGTGAPPFSHLLERNCGLLSTAILRPGPPQRAMPILLQIYVILIAL